MILNFLTRKAKRNFVGATALMPQELRRTQLVNNYVLECLGEAENLSKEGMVSRVLKKTVECARDSGFSEDEIVAVVRDAFKQEGV